MTRDAYDTIDPHGFIHPDDQDYQARRVQTLLNTGFFESELRLRHKDGHYVNLSTRSVTVRDDNGEVLGITYNFTRYYKAETGS